MASPSNQHCANCIDTLSFPTASRNLSCAQQQLIQFVAARRNILETTQGIYEKLEFCHLNQRIMSC